MPDVLVEPIDEQGNSTGEASPVQFEQRGTVGCHLERNPGKKPLKIWFRGTTDSRGKLRALGSGEYSEQMPSRGGASDDAAVCAFSAFTNSGAAITPRTNVKVWVNATFERDTLHSRSLTRPSTTALRPTRSSSLARRVLGLQGAGAS